MVLVLICPKSIKGHQLSWCRFTQKGKGFVLNESIFSYLMDALKYLNIPLKINVNIIRFKKQSKTIASPEKFDEGKLIRNQFEWFNTKPKKGLVLKRIENFYHYTTVHL